MVNITIENIKTQAKEHETIMEVAERIGIKIPHLCYLKDINEIGACRVCVVEIEGREKLMSACNTNAQEGMVIHVNSPKARLARRINVELILSQHNCNCPTCIRSGNCSLQEVANDLGILSFAYKKQIPRDYWDHESVLVRDDSKCIKCMRCIQVCDKIQSLGVWDIANTGSRTTVAVKDYLSLKDANCTFCGQCVTHCPVGALHERNDLDKVFRELNKKDKVYIAQIAPSVRVAWGEYFGLSSSEATEKKIVTALKKIGFDYVFDTNFAADLTIMEEGHEFLEKLKDKKPEDMPMFTSCCPAWVSFMKSQYPEYVENLSTSKSPQQMFAAVIKTYFADLIGKKPEEIYHVSFMPCMAKKDEIRRGSMSSTEAGYDVDEVLTTRELVRMIREEHIDIEALEETEFDNPLGMYSGAGAIFGATGGVAEAALRTVHYKVTGKNPENDAFKDIRGPEGVRIKTFDLNGKQIKVGIATGLANARRLIEMLKKKEINLDFVEVMACPGGCVGGGGQPFKDGMELYPSRTRDIYEIDKNSRYRCSHDNPQIQKLYEDFLGEPLSEIPHRLLHVKSHN